MKRTTIVTVVFLLLLISVRAATQPFHDWQTVAPRDEIRPKFSVEPRGGPKQAGSLVIRHDQREGLDGWF